MKKLGIQSSFFYQTSSCSSHSDAHPLSAPFSFMSLFITSFCSSFKCDFQSPTMPFRINVFCANGFLICRNVMISYVCFFDGIDIS